MRIIRNNFGPTFTLGTLFVGERRFWTCEDKVREEPGLPVEKWKIPGKTAIPMGNYRVIINESIRFKKRLPLLLDVPGFSGVRIHSGNTAEDTEGCILLGTGKGDDRVLNSRDAMALFMPVLEAELAKGDVWLQII